MLKNARKYLENELDFTNECLREAKEDYNYRKKEYDEAKELKQALDEKITSQKELMGTLSWTGVLGFLCVISLVVGWPLYFAIICGIFAVTKIRGLVTLIRQTVKTYKNFKKLYEESKYSFRDMIDYSNDIESFLYKRYEQPMHIDEVNIKNREECAHTLCEILASDDFVGMLKKNLDYDVCVEALKKEWEAYLEEISNTEYQTSLLKHLVTKEILSSIEPVSITPKTKKEKSLNLKIK